MDCLFWRIWAVMLVAALFWLGACVLYTSISSAQAQRTVVDVNIHSIGGRSVSYGEPLPVDIRSIGKRSIGYGEPLPVGAKDDLLPIDIKAIDGKRFGWGQISMFKPAMPVQVER
ncbi:MAG: hypothetical protein RMK18_06725 [Armatimonadota bacterium]|nr:hypothetical protein [Armatimonadota bacterium]MCX7777450.1 hypothetical protein [Armatimonadota bacterium]MDW8025542.1 hypothetical protein [Armatimonadota bacterium]